MPDVIKSPLIEFIQPFLDTEKMLMRRGRVYYTKSYYESNKLTNKPESFLESANNLFKWIRKNIKRSKPAGYEGLFVSER